MKKTTFYKGHKWTPDEVRKLMALWADEEPLPLIAEALNQTTSAVLKMVQRLRKEGIPLARRRRGHVAGRANKPWSQGEVEFLIRRRSEKATLEDIGVALGRSWNAVGAMVQTLRKEGVPIAMLGNGVRRLWDANALIGLATQSSESKIIELDARKAA